MYFIPKCFTKMNKSFVQTILRSASLRRIRLVSDDHLNSSIHSSCLKNQHRKIKKKPVGLPMHDLNTHPVFRGIKATMVLVPILHRRNRLLFSSPMTAESKLNYSIIESQLSLLAASHRIADISLAAINAGQHKKRREGCCP